MYKMLWKTLGVHFVLGIVWHADGTSKALRIPPGTELAYNKYSRTASTTHAAFNKHKHT